MRNILLASTMFLCVSSYTAPRPASAVIVTCANCSDIIDQLASYALQVQQKATEVAQLQTQLNSYYQQVQSGLALPQSIWSNVVSDINNVRNLANAASVLTGNSGTMLTRLQSAQGYANQASYLPSNIGQQFTMWQQTLSNAGLSLGRTLATQQQQQVGYASLQTQIATHSQTAAGQMQAIQSGNEVLGLISTQMNQVQTTLTTAAQEQATRDIVTADRQAVNDAAMQNLLQPMAIPLTGYQGY